jgi:hypothetical protein
MIRLLRLAIPLMMTCGNAAAQEFDNADHPGPPDYAEADNWALHEIDGDGRGADVFYIQPTSFRSTTWNQDLADTATRRWTDISVTARQTSLFDACCRRFMPRYRQASTRAFAERDGDGAKAYALAYSDVLRAFRSYIAHDNGGRPFIIAGHSQGALHGLRLIREAVAGTGLADRMVIAYLPGLGIPMSALPSDIGACATPAQVRCVVSWNSFDADADTHAYIARSVADYGVADGDDRLLCVNPLSFSLAVPAVRHPAGKGALSGPPVEGDRPRPVPEALTAWCDGGVLRVVPKSGIYTERLPGGNLHMNDISFFWGDIRADAIARVAAWQAAQGGRND